MHSGITGNGLADAAAKLVTEGTPSGSVDRQLCEEEIETTEHVLLRCPARQYAAGSSPATLDLRSAWYNATLQPKRSPHSFSAPLPPTL